MRQNFRKGASLLAAFCAAATVFLARPLPNASAAAPAPVAKKVINLKTSDALRLVEPTGVGPYGDGFVEIDGVYVCDAGEATDKTLGVSRRYALNQTTATPIVATGWSRAENVGGSVGADYSLYIDLEYADGTALWGQTAPFAVGDADWTEERLAIFPEKPIKSVAFYGLFRNRSGRASFRDLELREMKLSSDFYLFDGVPVERDAQTGATKPGPRPTLGAPTFLLRDAAKNGDFLRVEKSGDVDGVRVAIDGLNVVLENLAPVDRALTFVCSISVPKFEQAGSAEKTPACVWLDDPRRSRPIAGDGEFIASRSVPEIGGGRLSHYPIGGFYAPQVALDGSDENADAFGFGVDPDYPAFYRIAFNAASNELYVAFDVALTPEKPTAELRFHFLSATAEPGEGFRALLDAYRRAFPEAFVVRAPNQGNWMPFAPISKVPNPEDFGFQFKEGNDEVAFDDSLGITTFRYTEPMTWWQTLPKETPKTVAAALEIAKKQAADGVAAAQALLSCGHRDRNGQLCAIFLDTPWCDGAVWSLNDAPGLVKLANEGKLGDAKTPTLGGFETKWNDKIADELYGAPLPPSSVSNSRTPADFAAAQSRPGLDGEYIDSSEGYVTALLDFDRSHFAGMRTPLVFDAKTKRPAIYRGLIAFEYVARIAKDVRARNRLAMANSTPGQFFWLAPQLDVVGTETNWNWNGRWSPMSDADLLYRRAVCYGKPYCFLMNTNFDELGADCVEKYMKRALAYGMFPGFFSADASTKHYFSNPTLFERDRPLFKKYMPLCKAVAEAGWQAQTGAKSNDDKVYVERFGQLSAVDAASRSSEKSCYFTVLNDSQEERTFEIAFSPAGRRYLDPVGALVDRVSGKTFELRDGKLTATLAPEDAMVLEPVAETR